MRHYEDFTFIITGPRGSVGSYLSNNLSKYSTKVVSDKIDYTDYNSVKKLFDSIAGPKVILHTAFKCVRDYKSSTIEDFYKNILMYKNIVSLMSEKDRLYNFGSGIIYTTEPFDRNDFYKRAKKYINTEIVRNGYHLPSETLCKGFCQDILIYGMFDPSEDKTRFVSRCWRGGLLF